MRAMTLAALTGRTTTDFAEVFADHHDAALRLAYLLCGDPHRAEDAVADAFADAFVNVFRRWGRGRVDNPGAYVRRSVVNEVNSRFRRLALERREASKRSGDDRGARGLQEQIADSDELFAALRLLPDRQRTAIVLRFYEDLSEREAAEAMAVLVGTVKSSVSRGLAKLCVTLGPEVV
ncbi:MAG: sigma-70 family RNA polymerase sigma factor [Egibacteraceae bacterium]